MNEQKRYVRHVSCQGKKWEVLGEDEHAWRVYAADVFFYFPRSEYELCEPPEVWKDVTAECTVENDGQSLIHGGLVRFLGDVGSHGPVYRLRKTLNDAYIILERRED
jgi:hypothetical protein